jgi:hypothetical protein
MESLLIFESCWRRFTERYGMVRHAPYRGSMWWPSISTVPLTHVGDLHDRSSCAHGQQLRAIVSSAQLVSRHCRTCNSAAVLCCVTRRTFVFHVRLYG